MSLNNIRRQTEGERLALPSVGQPVGYKCNTGVRIHAPFMEVKGMGSAARLPGFKSQTHHVIPV